MNKAKRNKILAVAVIVFLISAMFPLSMFFTPIKSHTETLPMLVPKFTEFSPHWCDARYGSAPFVSEATWKSYRNASASSGGYKNGSLPMPFYVSAIGDSLGAKTIYRSFQTYQITGITNMEWIKIKSARLQIELKNDPASSWRDSVSGSKFFIVGDKDMLTQIPAWIKRPQSGTGESDNYNIAEYENSTGMTSSMNMSLRYLILGNFTFKTTGFFNISLSPLSGLMIPSSGIVRLAFVSQDDMNFTYPGLTNYRRVVSTTITNWKFNFSYVLGSKVVPISYQKGIIYSQAYTPLKWYASYANATLMHSEWHTARESNTANLGAWVLDAGAYSTNPMADYTMNFTGVMSRSFARFDLSEYTDDRPVNSVKIHMQLYAVSDYPMIMLGDDNNINPFSPITDLHNYHNIRYTQVIAQKSFDGKHFNVTLELNWKGLMDFRVGTGEYFAFALMSNPDYSDIWGTSGGWGGYSGCVLEIDWANEDFPAFDDITPPSYTAQFDWILDSGLLTVLWLVGLAVMIITPFITVREYGSDGYRLQGFIWAVILEAIGFALFWAGVYIPMILGV